jgi:glycine hydroxymethyltransferase
MIPFDPLDATRTSGLRLGTPAVTSRGMKEAQAEIIAGLISDAIDFRSDPVKISDVKKRVKDLCRKFPLDSRNCLLS